jgi:hypothetical protein
MIKNDIMKQSTYLLVIAFILFASACNKENIAVKDKNVTVKANSTLTGKWKLVESLADPGDGSGTWMAVSNSTQLLLNVNGTMSGNTFTEYIGFILKDSVTLTFSQADNTIQNYRYYIHQDTLSMSPDGPIWCIEGCGIRFKKED